MGKKVYYLGDMKGIEKLLKKRSYQCFKDEKEYEANFKDFSGVVRELCGVGKKKTAMGLMLK